MHSVVHEITLFAKGSKGKKVTFQKNIKHGFKRKKFQVVEEGGGRNMEIYIILILKELKYFIFIP